MRLAVESGVDGDRSAGSLAGLVGSRSELLSVEPNTAVASNVVVSAVLDWRNRESGVDLVDVASGSVVATASLNLTIVGSKGSAGVVKLQEFADGSVDTVEGGGVESSHGSGQGSAFSVAVNRVSNAQTLVVRLNSDVAGERVSRALVFVGIDASISITATGLDLRLDVLAGVPCLESRADRCGVAGVESGGVLHSLVGGIQGDRGAISVADAPSGSSQSLSVEIDSIPAADWEFSVRVGSRRNDVGIADVTEVEVVAAATKNFVVCRKASAGIVEIESSAD